MICFRKRRFVELDSLSASLNAHSHWRPFLSVGALAPYSRWRFRCTMVTDPVSMSQTINWNFYYGVIIERHLLNEKMKWSLAALLQSRRPSIQHDLVLKNHIESGVDKIWWVIVLLIFFLRHYTEPILLIGYLKS